MATKLKEIDAVVIGMGWAGALMARELTLAGLHVVGLERGPDRRPAEDFAMPGIRDELKYQQRLELMGDNSIDTITFRNRVRADGASHPALERVFAGRGGRRHRQSLGRGTLALSTGRFSTALVFAAALWRQIRSRDDDDPGLAREL